MSAGKVRAATGDNDLGFHTFFKHGWKRLCLKWYDHPIPSARRFCPRSHELLARIPAVKGAMFAVLPKGGYLGHHRDPFAGSLRYHLGLSTPNDSRCWIGVDGERRVWRDGEALVFDETFVHRANNRTETDRLVLLCDIERPMAAPLRPLNRWVMRHVMGATGTQNEPGEAIGAINRLYSRVSVIQQAIKSLKARNRRLYNLQKWATIAALLGLLLAPY